MSRFPIRALVATSAAPGANAALFDYFSASDSGYSANSNIFSPSSSFGSSNSAFPLPANFSRFGSDHSLIDTPVMVDDSYAQAGNGTANYSPFSPSASMNAVSPFAQSTSPAKPKPAKNAQFWPSNLEPNMRAIWGGPNVFDECASSFSSLFSSNTEPSQPDNLDITENSEMRLLTGRTSAYYTIFGADCIKMPTNGFTDYSLGTQAVPFRTLTAGAGTLAPGYKTNEQRKKQGPRNSKAMECAFCKNINSAAARTHWLKSNQGIITCPMLRAYDCPRCKNGGGDKAHTLRYCPLRRLQLADEFERVKVSPSKTNINFTTPQKQ